jgi:hypothetical protein
MTSHALLSPSSAHRWLHCTPSARLEATLPEQKRNPNLKDYSAEGTLAHSLSEIKLKYQLGQIGIEEHDTEIELCKNNLLYSIELEEVANSYVNYVRSQIGQNDKAIVEARVDIGEYVVESFGTSDCIILNERTLTVIDLKAGAGIPVSAINNEQLRLYALGSYERYKEEFPNLKEIRTIIVQPRLDSITEDTTTVTKLIEWGRHYVKKRAQKAYAGTGEFVPGDHCQFCRAKATCKARSDFTNEIASLDFRPAPLLTEEEFELVLSRASQLKSYVNDIEAYATQRAIDEDIIPVGFKLVVPKGHRKFSDFALAEVILLEKLNIQKEDLYETKPKSVPQIIKLGKKGQIESALGDLIVRPDSAPKLVPDNTQEDFA